MVSIPGLGRSPGGGLGYPLQYSFLPGESHGQRSLVVHRVHRVTKSRTQLKQLSTHALLKVICRLHLSKLEVRTGRA